MKYSLAIQHTSSTTPIWQSDNTICSIHNLLPYSSVFPTNRLRDLSDLSVPCLCRNRKRRVNQQTTWRWVVSKSTISQVPYVERVRACIPKLNPTLRHLLFYHPCASNLYSLPYFSLLLQHDAQMKYVLRVFLAHSKTLQTDQKIFIWVTI